MTIRKISEEEVRAHWIQRLPDAPSRQSRFGASGLSAAEMKAAYDALPLCIVEHFNELVSVIEEGRLAEWITGAEGRSLAAFLSDVGSGALADYLTLDGERSLRALAAAFDTHRHEGVYALLDQDGLLLPSQLPNGMAEAESERARAEEEREEAEGERRALAAACAAALSTLEKEKDALLARLSLAEERSLYAASTASRLSYTVENLAEAAVGKTHTFYKEEGLAGEWRVPQGSLPYARLLSLGGGDGMTAKTEAILSHGAGLLPYPYPAARKNGLPSGITVTPQKDGTILINGTAERGISYHLYRPEDGLRLPCEKIYIDPLGDGVELYLLTGSQGENIWKAGVFTPSREDEYFDRYHVYLYIRAGYSFDNAVISPSITRGARPRHGITYHPPKHLPIGEAITSLAGYGQAGNLLDLAEGVFRRRYSTAGLPLAEEELIPIAEEELSFGFIPVEEDGLISFKTDTGGAVRTSVLFGTKL